MNTGRLRGRTWPSALLAAALALAVNLPKLGGPAPWRDEAGTWVANQRSLGELLSMLSHTEAVHGFYYLLMRAWQWVFSDSIFSLRLVSTIAVAVTAGLVVVLGTAMFNLGVGRWAGLVYGLLPQATWAAGEARSYALSAAAVALAFLALWLALTHGSWARWLGFAAAAAVSVHLFLFSALAFLAVGPLMFFLEQRQRSRLAVATALAALASLPFALLGVSQSRMVAWLAKHSVTAETVMLQTFWRSTGWSAWVGAALLLGACGVAVAAVRRDRSARAPLLTVLGWLLIPMAVLLTVQLIKPVFNVRYVTFTAPALALLMGWALHQIRSWWGRAVAVALVLAVCVPTLLDSRMPDAKPSLAAAVHRLAEESQTGDGVLIVGDDINALGWAFGDQLDGLQIIGVDDSAKLRRRWLYARSAIPDRLTPEFEQHRRVWLFAAEADNKTQLAEAKRAMQQLGYAVEKQLRVEDNYQVDVVLVERRDAD